MKKKRITAKIILVSSLAALFISFLNNASVINAFKLMTTKQPEKITELFFTDNTDIPKKLKVNNLYRVDFTIKNHEYRDKAYTYEVIIIEENSKKVITVKRVYLSNNQSLQQQIHFKPTKPNARIKIIVLLNRKQEIRFKART